MKNFLLALGLLSALAAPAAARADTLYTINNGILTTYQSTTNVVGTYGGTFTLSSNFTILSGNLNATVNGVTFNLLNRIQDNDLQSGHAQFLDLSGDVFNLQLLGPQSSPVLCTVTLCNTQDSAFQPVVTFLAGNAYSANGGTLSPGAATVTPEPSSLVLLGTGLLGVVAAARRRMAASA